MLTSSQSSTDTLFFDDFNSGNSDNWTWTGDPRGGGTFAVEDSVFQAQNTEHRHYVLKTSVFGAAIYEFDALFPSMDIAFRITPSNALSGTAVRIVFVSGQL